MGFKLLKTDEAEIRGSFAHSLAEKGFELQADLTLRPGGGLNWRTCTVGLGA